MFGLPTKTLEQQRDVQMKFEHMKSSLNKCTFDFEH